MADAKSSQNSAMMLYGTCPDMDCARKLAKSLLDERLVACVNLIPGMVSMYRWQGSVKESQEVTFIAKTTKPCWDQASALFAELHPYDEPALIALNVTDGLAGYLNWVNLETRD